MRMRRNACNRRCRNCGVGLIEVLIAILILAIGLLGIAALQATTLRNSQSALERTQATVQTYAILDAMRANVAAARIGQYDMPMACDAPDAGDLVADDLRNWINSLKRTLGPTACGRIECGSLKCEIAVQWDDSRATGAPNREEVDPALTRTVLTVTRL